jgi:hypothetical protein
MLKRLLSLTLLVCICFFAPEVQACEALDEADNKVETLDLNRQDLIDCLERGEDPQLRFREMGGQGYKRAMGSGAQTTFGLCRPGFNDTCPNSQNINVRPGDMQGSNPLINNALEPSVRPWEELLREGELDPTPCGASANLTDIAFSAINNNNVRLNGTLDLSNNGLGNLIISFFMDLIEGFMNWLRCQDATLWNVISGVINLFIPPTEDSIALVDGVFEMPADGIAYLPPGMDLEINLPNGGATFNLPIGGSFTDANGNTITIDAGHTVSFNPNNTVTIEDEDGNEVSSHRLPSGGTAILDANGAVTVPAGTQIPAGSFGGVLTPGTFRPEGYMGR